MAKTKNSKKGKGTYAAYKAENRAYKNKLRKFESIVNRFPNDEEAKKTLDRLREGPAKYKHKQRPNVPGSNKTIPNYRTDFVITVETAGEQLSRLLGIPLPKVRTRRPKKTSVTVRKKKNVKKP